MTLNFATPTQKIVCFDILNSTWEETNANALAFGFHDFIIHFIKSRFEELHSDQNNPNCISKIYFEDNYIVSCVELSCHNEFYGIVSSIDYELIEIKPVSSKIYNSNKLVESIVAKFNKCRSLVLNEIENDELLKYSQIINTNPSYDFESEMINLEVKNELKLTLDEFTNRFNVNIIFEKQYLKLKTHRFKLSSIYYRNSLPIAFSFDYYGKTYIGWNEEYLITISNIKPVNLILLSKTEQLNSILDKINDVGLANLEKSELEFLETFE